MTPNRIHDALPWFVNGTLEPEEAATFERHLMDCADCRQELEFLEKLKAQIERHGDDFLADHPPPEKLVTLLGPGNGEEVQGEEEVTRLRRHLALCATCAEEARELKARASSVDMAALKRWLHIDSSELPAGERAKFQEVLEKTSAVKTVYTMRQELAAVWQRSSASKEELVHRLEDWCHRAEKSGVAALQEFSRSLRCYA